MKDRNDITQFLIKMSYLLMGQKREKAIIYIIHHDGWHRYLVGKLKPGDKE